MAAHEPSLLPDKTIFIQLGLFFASYFVLNLLVFKPYVALIERRREKSSGLKEKAAEDREKAEKFKVDYEALMKDERRKVNAWLDDEKKKVSDEERNIIQTTRDTIAKELALSEENLRKDVEKARGELLPLMNEFSSQIATKVLGRNVKVSAASLVDGKDSGVEQRV